MQIRQSVEQGVDRHDNHQDHERGDRRIDQREEPSRLGTAFLLGSSEIVSVQLP